MCAMMNNDGKNKKKKAQIKKEKKKTKKEREEAESLFILFSLRRNQREEVGLDKVDDSFVNLLKSRESLDSITPASEARTVGTNTISKTQQVKLVSFDEVGDISEGDTASLRDEVGRGDFLAFFILGAILAHDEVASSSEHVDNLTFEGGIQEVVDLLAGQSQGLLGEEGNEEGAEDVLGDVAVDSHTIQGHLDNLGAEKGVLGEEGFTLFAGDVADVLSDGEGVEDTINLLAGFLVQDDEGGDGTEAGDGFKVFFLGGVCGHSDLEVEGDLEQRHQPDDGTRGLSDGMSVEFVFVVGGHGIFLF